MLTGWFCYCKGDCGVHDSSQPKLSNVFHWNLGLGQLLEINEPKDRMMSKCSSKITDNNYKYEQFEIWFVDQ